MDQLKIRLATAKKVLATLQELAHFNNPTSEQRDAAIQRFEYTFEACWKAIPSFLMEHEGLSIGSPKGCIRASREVGLLSEDETVQALEMADDRNLTSHTYNEGLASQIYRHLAQYAKLLEDWLRMVEERLFSS